MAVTDGASAIELKVGSPTVLSADADSTLDRKAGSVQGAADLV